MHSSKTSQQQSQKKTTQIKTQPKTQTQNEGFQENTRKQQQQQQQQKQQQQEDQDKKNQIQDLFKFVELDSLNDSLKEDSLQLDKYNSKADPTLLNIGGKDQLIGSEGVMRKWLYRNKFSINESDFTTIQRQTVDVKDILKVLKTNDTEEGLQKLFQTIRYFDCFFGKLMEFEMINILKHEKLYKELSTSMSRRMNAPINLEPWSVRSVIELMQYNADRSSDIEDFLISINKKDHVFKGNQNISQESEKLANKITELETLIQKLKEENLDLKQKMISTSESSIFNMEPNKASKHLFDQLKYFYKGVLEKHTTELNLLKNDIVEKDIQISSLKAQLQDSKTQLQFLKEQEESNNAKHHLVDKMEKESNFEWALREECQRVKQASRNQLIDLQKQIAEQRYQQQNEINQLNNQLDKALQARKFLLNKLQIYTQEDDELDSESISITDLEL